MRLKRATSGAIRTSASLPESTTPRAIRSSCGSRRAARLATLSIRTRPLVQIGNCCEVLRNVSQRLVDRDLAVILAPPDAPRENFADLADHMAIVDQAGVARRRQLSGLSEHAWTIIGNVASLRHERRVHFDRPQIARTDEVDVRPRLYPLAKEDRLSGRRNSANYVGPRSGFLSV